MIFFLKVLGCLGIVAVVVLGIATGLYVWVMTRG